MSKKAIKWLYQQLPGLVAQGILSEQAAAKLQQHYGEVKDTGKKMVALIMCGALGALLIGLGIILLLGHNWEQLSRPIRAVLSILPLVIGQAFALWVLRNRSESSGLKEATAIFLSLMVGASIALISQTYNIPGNTDTFILTWMLLIAPLIYLMQASLPAAIYLIGITCWSGSYWNNPKMAILFWPLAAVVIPHFIWALRRNIYTIRASILSLIMVGCVLFGASFSLGKAWPNFWTIIFPSIFAIFYYVGHKEFKQFTSNWQGPLRLVSTLGIVVIAFQFTFRYIWEHTYRVYPSYGRELSGLSALPDHFISFLIVALALVIFYDNLKNKNLTGSLFTGFPLLALIGYFAREQTLVFPLLIFNAYLLYLSLSRIIIGIRNNSLAAINMGMLILGILIIARFFDSDINFLFKGLVFIVLGIGFLVTNVVLIRRKGGAQ
ncbi:MAG: DUF2157 domain-containing protein [Candidatus Omnitrophica bacterium]|nr:DUF2157 domain-containing protein [Candidatus Omnitrophota bacterium]